MKGAHAAHVRALACGASTPLRCAAARGADAPQSSQEHVHTGRQYYVDLRYKFRRP